MSESVDMPAAGDPSTAPQEKKSLGFEFHGDGTEYFKIWIVNILLTIVTLGIYSAWAKVRNHRYFYSNLYLDGDNFRYLADPITILKGRLLALAAFIMYSVASIFYPSVAAVLAIILFLSIPFFINQSIAFNNRMSSYKNIQFRFKGSYLEAFMVIYVWPLLGIISLGLLYPLALLKANEYFVRNSSYGTSHFDFNATYKDYMLIFLAMLGIVLVGSALIALLTYLVPDISVLSGVVLSAMFFAVIVYAMVSFTNLYYASLSLVDHQFEAKLHVVDLTKVVLINLLLIMITLGFYLPAAKVRMTKYICSCLALHTSGGLEDFIAAEKENVSVLGEEFGEVFDFT